MSDNNVNFTHATDGFHLDFPAIMNDGRQFTDYRSNCFMNAPEKKMSTFEYRQFLKNNAVKIMNNKEKIQGYVSECKSCSDYSIVEPSLYLTCDASNCTSNIMNNDGIGLYVKY